MAKFRKKSVVIEAYRFTEENKDYVYHCCSAIQMNVYPSYDKNGKPALLIPTLDGEMLAELGDYVIIEPFPTGWRKLYPCKPDIFEKTYEKVNGHLSDCAVHNMPAMPNGNCTCGYETAEQNEIELIEKSLTRLINLSIDLIQLSTQNREKYKSSIPDEPAWEDGLFMIDIFTKLNKDLIVKLSKNMSVFKETCKKVSDAKHWL